MEMNAERPERFLEAVVVLINRNTSNTHTVLYITRPRLLLTIIPMLQMRILSQNENTIVG
jgi:hypothetical protein